MTMAAEVIVIERDGPAGIGLVEWETIDPGPLVSGEPVQRGHIYHQNDSIGYLVGVWDCTPQTEAMGPYPVDEFMLLLEGSLVMVLPDGSEITINAGEPFIIPKGFECQWRQAEYVRKIFMIVDDPVDSTGGNPSLSRITLPDLAPSARTDDKAGPIAQTATSFINSTGQMSVQVSSFSAITIAEATVGANTLSHVLEGSVTITAQGNAQTFEAGQTFYITQGSRIGWQTDNACRLLQAKYQVPSGA